MSKFWLYACKTNEYMHEKHMDITAVFDTFEIAKEDAQRRYAMPEDDYRWINYARILEVDNDVPVEMWATPDQPIDDGLLETLEFYPDACYPDFWVKGRPDYWDDKI